MNQRREIIYLLCFVTRSLEQMENTWYCLPENFTFAMSDPRTDTRPINAAPSIDSPEKQDCLPPRDVSSLPVSDDHKKRSVSTSLKSRFWFITSFSLPYALRSVINAELRYRIACKYLCMFFKTVKIRIVFLVSNLEGNRVRVQEWNNCHSSRDEVKRQFKRFRFSSLFSLSICFIFFLQQLLGLEIYRHTR